MTADLRGQRFGRWLVVARAPNIGRNPSWVCRCECGQQRVIRAFDLHHDRTRQCPACAGASRRIDLTGMQFGSWTVLERSTQTSPSRDTMWTCRCECGREFTVAGRGLRRGDSTACRYCHPGAIRR